MLSSESDSCVVGFTCSQYSNDCTVTQSVVATKLNGTTPLMYLTSEKMFSRLQKVFKSKNLNPSLLEIFKPIYVLLTILGLFPFNIKFKTKHICVIVHRSIYLNSLRAVSVLLLMLVFAGLFIRNLALGVSIKDKAMMTHINYILEVVFLLATCVTAYGSIYIYRYTIVNILNSLASAWVELPNSRNNILKNLQFRVKLILFFLALVLITEIAINFSRHDGLWKMINVTLSFIYPHMIQFIVLTFYCVLVLFVVALLTNLNEVLETLRSKRKVVGCIRNLERRVTVLDLTTLESVFVKAFEIKRDINETFQATILLTAMQCFHSIISEAHIIYHGVVVARTLTTHESINFSVWIGYQFIKIYALAYSGNLLKLATVKIGQTLHSIPVDNHDMRSLIETQHFTSLMAYQSTDLSVYGYFSLDASFLFNVISSTTMYLIILVQFDK